MRLTLLTDGSSDRVLEPMLRWMIAQQWRSAATINWADLRMLARPPGRLPDRVACALQLHPCDLLVVHRDAERELPAVRCREIEEATAGLAVAVVAAVPVRMIEAWLLFDESAIRRAAGNPNGTAPLGLPALVRAESLPDPKRLLHDALLAASGLQGRRRSSFRPNIHRLADLVEDFSPLRILPSFATFEGHLLATLTALYAQRGEGPG